MRRMMMRRKRLKERSNCVPPFRFFTIILPPTLTPSSILHHHHLLRLPKAFAAEFGDHISGVATLTVPTGTAWKVHLLKKDDQLYFGEGWTAFMNYNHVKHGYFLEFEYLRQHTNVSFNVHIYDLSCCEITYPDSQIPVIQRNDDSASFGSKEASFRIQARSSHYSTSSSYMHIPIKFREKYMRETRIRWMKLQAEDGREWCAEICNYAVGFRIRGVGWSKFTKDINWGVAAKFYRFILLSKDAHCFVFKVIPVASAAS